MFKQQCMIFDAIFPIINFKTCIYPSFVAYVVVLLCEYTFIEIYLS